MLLMTATTMATKTTDMRGRDKQPPSWGVVGVMPSATDTRMTDMHGHEKQLPSWGVVAAAMILHRPRAAIPAPVTPARAKRLSAATVVVAATMVPAAATGAVVAALAAPAALVAAPTAA